VVKDNLVFGVRERPESFAQKLSIEEDELLRNREAWFAQAHDRRCDFWLEFENGVKMLVEMVDSLTANMNEIPLHEPEAVAGVSKVDNSIIQEPSGEYIEGASGMDLKQEEPVTTTVVQSQESIAAGDQSPTTNAAEKRLQSAQNKHRPQPAQDNYEALKGARLNFTFEDGLTL
jgi:hypothetical protein